MNNEVENIEKEESVKNKPVENTNGNYILSIILAVVFALFGLLPAIITLLYAGYFVGILYMLSPVAAFFGYRLGKAPLNKIIYFVCFGASVIANYLTMSYVYQQFAEIAGVSIEVIKTNPEFGYKSDMIMSFVFLAVGMYLSYSFIARKLNQKDTK